MIVAARDREFTEAFGGNLVGRGRLNSLHKTLAGVGIYRIDAFNSTSWNSSYPNSRAAGKSRCPRTTATTIGIHKGGAFH